MNCNKIEDKLIDYIERDLSKEEELEIKRHIDECEDCKKEYKELKSTIIYIKNNSKDIDKEKELNLNANINKKGVFKRFTRTGTIAIAISLLLVVTAFAVDMLGFMDMWKKSSEERIMSWEELIENGLGQKLNISTEDKGIKVTAKGVIADDLNTLVLLEVQDLNGDIKFTPRNEKYYIDVVIGGDIPWTTEEIPPLVNSYNIYNEYKGKLNVLLKMEAIEKDEGTVDISINNFMSMINKDEQSIANVEGNWSISIPVEKLQTKVYSVDEKIDLDGNELIIEEIIVAPTTTSIKYKFDVYNKEKNYFLRSLTFLIESNGEIYKQSNLSYADGGETKNFGYQEGEFHLESLYLEDPEDLEIIVETARYISRGVERYDIDWDDLPQKIEYQGSKITVKDIKYNEDSTEIIFEEDKSGRRKYIDSNIYFRKYFKKEIEDEGEIISFDVDYKFHANTIKSKVKDENGEVKDETKPWSWKRYDFVLEQKLVLDEGRMIEIFGDKIIYDKEEFLKPDTIYIEGQRFIEYPNIKKNIKLK